MLLWIVLLYFSKCINAQTQYEIQAGNFSLGVRTVTSAFGHGNLKEVGYGMGGHSPQNESIPNGMLTLLLQI